MKSNTNRVIVYCRSISRVLVLFCFLFNFLPNKASAQAVSAAQAYSQALIAKRIAIAGQLIAKRATKANRVQDLRIQELETSISEIKTLGGVPDSVSTDQIQDRAVTNEKLSISSGEYLCSNPGGGITECDIGEHHFCAFAVDYPTAAGVRICTISKAHATVEEPNKWTIFINSTAPATCVVNCF